MSIFKRTSRYLLAGTALLASTLGLAPTAQAHGPSAFGLLASVPARFTTPDLAVVSADPYAGKQKLQQLHFGSDVTFYAVVSCKHATVTKPVALVTSLNGTEVSHFRGGITMSAGDTVSFTMPAVKITQPVGTTLTFTTEVNPNVGAPGDGHLVAETTYANNTATTTCVVVP